MVADHLIEFKGCRRHTRVMGDGISGMEEFVKNRKRLRRRIPEFGDPDFAQVERLPVNARPIEDQDNDVEDEWRKFSHDPLEHMTANEWKQCHKTVGHIFTGGNESDEEDAERVDRYLEVGK